MMPAPARRVRAMSRVYRWLFAGALALSVSGCSTISGWFDFDDEDDPKQPAELMDIQETVKIKKL